MPQSTQPLLDDAMRFRNILEQSPLAMAILLGPRFIVELVNTKKLLIWNRTREEVQGKPLFDVFPETRSQDYRSILQTVYSTGKPYRGKEKQAQFIRNGALETGYFNVSYEAFRNDAGEVAGIIMVSTEVTDEVLARKKEVVLDITEQIFINQFHLGASKIGLWHWNVVSGEVTWSKTQHELYGLTDGEFAGTLEDFYSFLLPEEIAGLKAESALALRKDSYHEYQFRIRRKDGKVRWMQSRTHNIFDEDSILMAVAGVNIDISEQKAQTEKLMQSLNQLRLFEQVVVNIKDAILITEAEPVAAPGPRIVYANEAFCAMTGYTKEEVIGQTPRLLQGPKTNRRELDKIHKALTNWQSVKVELCNYRKDGSEFCVEVNISPVTDEKGWFIYWVSVQRDITDQKRADKKLRDSEARFRNIFNTAAASIWEVDFSQLKKEVDCLKAEGIVDFEQYLTSNPGFAEEKGKMMVKDVNDFTLGLFSLEKKADLKNLMARLFLPETNIMVGKMLTAIADNRPYFEAETMLQNIHGNRMHVLFSVNLPVETDYSSVLVCMVDITQQKTISQTLEQLVQKRTHQLQRSNEDLQQFAHVASHDLKEPIRKIRIFGNRLVNEFGPKLPAEAQSYLAKIETAAICMYAMIDDVLLYSSLDAVEQPLQVVDLNIVMENITRDLELVIEEKKAVLLYGQLHSLHGVPMLIYQLFYNLVCNALKFTKSDEPPVIQVASKDVKHNEKKFIQITVLDNGIGFLPEYAKKIFNMFTRLHSKTSFEGTGLGLTLCKKIAERHGGTIDAKGEPDKGATFTVIWPNP